MRLLPLLAVPLALAACAAPTPVVAPLSGLSLSIQLSETNDPNSWTHGAQHVEFRTFGHPHDFNDRGATLLGTVDTDAQGRGTLTLPGEQGLAGTERQAASGALNAATEWFRCAAPLLTSSDAQAQVVVGAIGLVKLPKFDSPVWSVNPDTRQSDLLIFATRATTLTGTFPGSVSCHSDGAQIADVQLDAGWNIVRYDQNAAVGSNAVRRITAAELLPFQDD